MDEKTVKRLSTWMFSRLPLIGSWLRRRALRELAADGSLLALETLASGLDRMPDQQSQAFILQAIELFQSQRQVDAACRAWLKTRSVNLARLISRRAWVASAPPEALVYSALQAGRLEIAQGVSPAGLDALLHASLDRDAQLAQRAQACLAKLTDQTTIDALAGWWVAARHGKPEAAAYSHPLDQALAMGKYIASRPPETRALTALHCANPAALQQDGPEIVSALVDLLPDPQVGPQASLALAGLTRRQSQEAVCQLAIQLDDPALRQAVLAGGYLPADLPQRALFFFITEQLERYESLDFDHSLLRAIYDAAEPALRERINSRLRRAGRPGYLNILVGGDESSRLRQMSTTEIELMLQLLQSDRQWSRLWGLALKLPLAYALRALRALQSAGWQPPDEEEQAVFRRIVSLSDEATLAASADIGVNMTPAVLRARVRLVHGRLNDLAFAPGQPHIALGTSRRRVVVWDFQVGQPHLTLKSAGSASFSHSIGEVTYTRRGDLLFAERTNNDKEHCKVYAYREGEIQAIYNETGSVTALEPVSAAGFLLTGRSQFVTLFEMDGAPTQVLRKVFPFWPRAACVHPQRPLAALLHSGALLITLPELQALTPERDTRQMVSCGTFVPGSDDLLLGKLNGQSVLITRRKASLSKPEDLKPLRHNGRVVGLAALRRYPLVISAGSDGLLQFMSWPGRRASGQLGAAGEPIQSLHVSPDESFLAVAHAENTLSLWDLRIQELPELFSRPLIEATPNQLAILQALQRPVVAGPPALTPAGQQAVTVAVLLLQHRLRHEIEIEAAPEIKSGEFDIEIV